MLDGIQLYDQEEKPIDPNTKATAVFQNSISGADNVESALKALDNKINTNTEDLQEKFNEVLEKEGIKPVITTGYCALKTKEQSDVIAQDDDGKILWIGSYQFPTKDLPYTWKKTTTTVADDISSSYELVTMLNTNKIQNIYLATNKDEKVDIIYPKREDPSKPEEEWEDNIQVDDTYTFKTSNGQNWLNYPVSLDNNNVYLWMATRKYENEVWTRFEPENGARIGYFYTAPDSITE